MFSWYLLVFQSEGCLKRLGQQLLQSLDFPIWLYPCALTLFFLPYVEYASERIMWLLLHLPSCIEGVVRPSKLWNNFQPSSFFKGKVIFLFSKLVMGDWRPLFLFPNKDIQHHLRGSWKPKHQHFYFCAELSLNISIYWFIRIALFSE